MNKWDKIFFEKNPKYKPLNEIRLKELLKKIKSLINREPKTVVDLGCGTGDALVKFKKVGLDVTGVDFSKVALDKAKELLKEEHVYDVEVILDDLDSLSVKKEADIYFCKLVYAFLKDKERFLERVKDLMSDESVFILITPVLHKSIDYTKEDKPGIAVDFEEINKLLKEKFSKVEELYHDEFGDRGDTVTYLLLK